MHIRRAFLAAALAAFAMGSAPAILDGQAEAKAHARTDPLEVVSSGGKVAHFKVEFVDSGAARQRGLMFRKSVAADGGMLFDFKTSQEVSFWMKNTLIPLDMLFIDPAGRIVNIHRNAIPHDETPIPSDGPVRAVLELRGGRAQELDIMPGDQVRHRIFPR